MANGFLQIVTNPDHPTYSQGDIKSAVPYIAVRKDEMDKHCLRRNPTTRQFARLNPQGFFDVTDVLADYGEACYEMRMERLSRLEMRMTRISDGAEIRFRSGERFQQFDGKIVAMDVELYFSRAVTTLQKANAQGKPLFGTDPHQLRYYSGKETYETPNVDTVWTAVANKLQVPEPPDMIAHFSNMRANLVLPVDDFDREEGGVLTASLESDPDAEGNTTILAKRACMVDYHALGFTPEELGRIDDPKDLFDLRRRTPVQRQGTIKKKQRSGGPPIILPPRGQR